MTATSPAVAAPQRYLEAQTRWHVIEIAFWLATLLPFVVTPNYLQLASQIAITALFALSLDLILGYAGYTYSLVVLFLTFRVARRLINSPFGLALRGIRENAVRMPAIGAPSPAHIRKVYTIAAVMAGIAGALLAQTTETVSLETLSFARSADVLVILILGGAGRLYGGIVGAIIYMRS